MLLTLWFEPSSGALLIILQKEQKELQSDILGLKDPLRVQKVKKGSTLEHLQDVLRKSEKQFTTLTLFLLVHKRMTYQTIPDSIQPKEHKTDFCILHI